MGGLSPIQEVKFLAIDSRSLMGKRHERMIEVFDDKERLLP